MPNPKKPRANCLNCGTPVKLAVAMYRSNNCQNEHQYKGYIERWLAGLETGRSSGGALSWHVRRYLKSERGEHCEQCGWNQRHPVTGKVPVTFDHIDGDWRNCRPENLRILCPNCHALTPTYQALNKGNGRSWRYKKTKPTWLNGRAEHS